MRTPIVVVLVAAGLGAGVAAAAPAVQQGTTPGAICTPPGSDKCLEQRLEAFHLGSNAPTLKMLRPNKRDIPTDLRDGKYFPYKPKVPLAKAGSHALARTKITRMSVARDEHIDAATAAKAHRNQAWDDNGQKITSCAEYAYEQVYDVAQFIDAAAACKGDTTCVIDVAFLPQNPGIAERPLTRKDGKPLQSGGPLPAQLNLYRGVLPKNDLFAATADFIYSNGAQPLAPTAELTALAAALDKGRLYYRTDCTGNTCNDRNFADEWKWHRALRQRTAAVSDAEFAEYERRKAEFRALLASWHAAAEKELKSVPEEVARVMPYDMRTADPFERLDIATRYVRDIRVAGQKFRKTATPQQLDRALGKNPAQSPAQQGAQGSVQDWTPALGLLAAPSPAPRSQQKPGPSQNPGAQPTQNQGALDPCLLQQQWGGELLHRGPLSCKIGQFLRTEWRRKLQGKKSCLDVDSFDCDWSPAMFMARFVDQVPTLDRQAFHERRCTDWTGGALSNKKNLGEVEDYIKLMEEKVGVAKRALAPFSKDGGKRFGRDWGDGERFGDKGYFAAGYDFDLGFSVESLASDDNRVCELSGGFNASAEFYGHVFGSDRIEVAHALLSGTANKNRDHKGRLSSHLRVLGQDLYNPLADETVTTVFSEADSGFTMQVPPGGPLARPSFTVMAGPIPITGSAWGELTFGSALEFGVKAPTGCDVLDPRFRLGATFLPLFLASARAQVGVGVSGIVSAGVRGTLNLLTLSLPFEVGLTGKIATVAGEAQPALDFDMQLSMLLSTLSGRISLYLEFLLYEEEWELFRWKGLGPATLPLLPRVTASLPLLGMTPG